MDTFEVEITPSKFKKMIGEGTNIIQLDDDFVIARELGNKNLKSLKYPFKINSYIAAYCYEGEVNCTVNLTDYKLTKGMLLIILPGNIVRISGDNQNKQFECSKFTILDVAVGFLSKVGLDINKIFMETLTLLKKPCIRLTEEERTLLGKYVDLITDIIHKNDRYTRESISSIISSVFYQFAGFLYKERPTTEEHNIHSNRHKIMFEQFIMLVSEHHMKERLVGFYANELCVTPKYLSRIIKEVSGKTAPEWIDDFVILTAKHLLKHSNLSIKEIAIKLNFQSQSFFFRFFKRVTGLTPTQYRIE